MSDDRLSGKPGTAIFSFVAGSLGGITLGLFEVLLIAKFGAVPANLSGLLFAVIAYGILGGLAGIGLNILLQILPFHQERKASRRYIGAAVYSATLSLIFFLVFLFRAFRDFHGERVRYLEPTGLLTIAILIAASLVLFFIVRLILVGPLKGVLNWFTRPLGYGALVIVLMIAGVVLSKLLSAETVAVYHEYSAAGQEALAEKPCVILIMVDTLRPDYLGCYGNDSLATPNIDALARDATLFTTTYSQATYTKPSTASLLSSRYPTEHQAIHKNQILPENITTLAELFTQAGYYSGSIVTNINLAPIFNFQQGFHEYVYLPPKFLFGANEAASRLVLYGVLRQVRRKVVQSKFPYHYYQEAEVVTGYFDDFLSRNKDQKFFLFIHYMDPHDPYFEHPYSGKGYARAANPNPDPKFEGPFRDFYAQEIEYLDAWIGQLLSRLKAEGLYDNCVIAFTSDHGEEFQEHGGWWHGNTLHEEQVRVPLLVKRPNGLGSEMIVESLTNSIDIAPTLLAAAGLDSPPVMHGRDLFANPLNEDFVPEVYSEADFEGNVVKMLRIGPWKYIETNPDNPRRRPPQQLFYVPDDPSEKINLFEVEPAKAKDMQLLLEAKYQELLAAKEEGAQQEMDRATKERLRALGYTQ